MKLLEDIKKYARQTPFRPFLIETTSGTQFMVEDSYHIAIDDQRGRVVVFDGLGLVEIIDLDAVDRNRPMNNPNAVALGKLGKGRPKTMTPAALEQRKIAAKARSKHAKARREAKAK